MTSTTKQMRPNGKGGGKRMLEVVVITGAIKRAKLQSGHHHQQTNTLHFSRPDIHPVALPTAQTTKVLNDLCENNGYEGVKK